MPCASLFFSEQRPAVPSITLLRKPQSEKPRGSGGSAPSSNTTLQLLNMDSIAGRQTPPDSVQFAVAVFFVAQVLAPLRRRVLAGKHGRGFQIRPGFDQVVEDLDPVLRIPADCEIVNEEDLNPGIVFQLLPVLVQIVAAAQDEQFIQQVTVIHKHTAVVAVAGFVAKRRHEVGLACFGNAIDANIQPFLGKAERKQLLNHSVVVAPLAAGDEVLRDCTLVNELAEPQVCPVAVIHRLNVLRLQNFPEQLVRREIGQL